MDIKTVEFHNVNVGYPGVELLRHVSCQWPRGEVIRVRGSTGSGKSALLKLAGGLLTPLAGEYLINGQSVREMSFEEFLPYQLNIGYGFDAGGLLNNRTLRENLALPLEYHKRFDSDEIRRLVDMSLDLFDLTKAADRRPSAVSGSQRKACCVARALIHNPQMLILDDPATGLGDHAKNTMVKIIKESIHRGHLRFVLMTSEDAFLAAHLKARDLMIQGDRVEWAESLDSHTEEVAS